MNEILMDVGGAVVGLVVGCGILVMVIHALRIRLRQDIARWPALVEVLRMYDGVTDHVTDPGHPKCR